MENQENNNSASRARWLLLNAQHEQDAISTIEAWTNVLIPEREEQIVPFQTDHYIVLRLIDALRSEIRAVSAGLEAKGVPRQLYEEHIKNAL